MSSTSSRLVTLVCALTLAACVPLTAGKGAATEASPIQAPAVQPATVARPSIVLILTDDLDWASMTMLPRLKESMTDRGTTFSSFFVNDSLCCPSRTTILRGQYMHNHGVLSNSPPDGGYQKFMDRKLERSTVATWLQAAGYRTMMLGKYLNGYPDDSDPKHVPPGWSRWFVPSGGDPYTQFDYEMNEDGRPVRRAHQAKDYLNDVLTSKAVKSIEEAAGDGVPFFLYLAPYSPHKPSTPAPRHEGSMAGLPSPRPPSFDEVDLSDKPAWVRAIPRLSRSSIAEIDTEWGRRVESMLSVEEMVDRVIDALRAAGRLDDTYIFFASDNGYHLGQHRLVPGKQTPYEEDIRVPLIVRGPGVPQGAVIDHLTGNVDLAPTFASLAGAAIPDFVDGRSLVPLLGSTPPPIESWRQAFLLEHTRMKGAPRHSTRSSSRKFSREGTREPADAFESRFTSWRQAAFIPRFEALRLRDHIYVEYGSGEREMYDLAVDPYEEQNIAGRADPALLKTFATWLAALRDCRGASCRALEEASPAP